MIVSSELNMLMPHMIVSHGLNLIIHMVASPELNMISLCISSMMASSFLVSIIAHVHVQCFDAMMTCERHPGCLTDLYNHEE